MPPRQSLFLTLTLLNTHTHTHTRNLGFTHVGCAYFCEILQFFKDRHYLEKDWGCFFAEDDLSSNGKVVLEVNILSFFFLLGYYDSGFDIF